MCVLAFAWRANPKWLLVAAGNRDELHARPAQSLARWNFPSHILAGRDLQSKGSWLGVSEQGRFAVVTNLRGYGAPRPDRPSRGALVTDFLAREGCDGELCKAELADFNPFNLLVADREHAQFLTNRPENIVRPLGPGIYGLSNGELDEPWPKTMRLKATLLEWTLSSASRPEVLLDTLRDDHLPEVGAGSPGPSDVPQEPALSPIFIRSSVYGTRCSTLVAIDNHGHGVIVERRYTPVGENAGETSLSFSWAD